MPIEVFSIDQYKITSSDTFFFDNNIWMYLFCPIGNHEQRKQRKYSSLLDQLMGRNNHIYTNSLTLSEFANSYLKLDYNIQKNKAENAGVYNNYKADYFYSDRAIETKKAVNIAMEKILKICQKNSDEFPNIDLNNIISLSTFLGFNDSYYVHWSNKKNFRIVTDDGDFTSKLKLKEVEPIIKALNLKIITA